MQQPMTPRAEIAQIKLFEELESAEIDGLSQLVTLRRYKDGQLVLLEGDVDAPVFFVVQGTVRVFRTSLEGREQTLAHLRPGDALNLPSAFVEEPVVPASAMAIGDIRALTIRPSQLRMAAARWPGVAMALLSELSEKLQHLSALSASLSLLSVRARLARFLLNQYETPSDPPIRWTHAEIASRIGTVRVVVSRTLSALAQEEIIRLDRHRIEILDAKALAEIAEL